MHAEISDNMRFRRTAFQLPHTLRQEAAMLANMLHAELKRRLLLEEEEEEEETDAMVGAGDSAHTNEDEENENGNDCDDEGSEDDERISTLERIAANDLQYDDST